MSPIPGGVRFTGFVAPSDTADTYYVTDPIYGKGSYREVADLTARDAITTERRRIGMLVYVQSNDTVYILKGVTDNSGWTVFVTGSGGVTIPSTRVPFGDATNQLTTSPNFIWNDASQFLQVPSLVLPIGALGTLVPGKIENNGTDLYANPSGANRYKVLLQKYLGSPYVVSFDTDHRTLNAQDVNLDTLANIVATIIKDLQLTGIFH